MPQPKGTPALQGREDVRPMRFGRALWTGRRTAGIGSASTDCFGKEKLKKR